MWRGFRMRRLVWSRLAGFRRSVFEVLRMEFAKIKKRLVLPEVTRLLIKMR
jgi:hypothetical protein